MGRYPVHYRDLPAFGMPGALDLEAPALAVSEPRVQDQDLVGGLGPDGVGNDADQAAAMEITRQVGQVHSVKEVAEEFGVSWEVAMNAVVEFGQPLVDDEDRVDEVEELGVDETSFLKATAQHHTQYATGLVDLQARQMIDFIEGNSADDLHKWIEKQPPESSSIPPQDSEKSL